MSESDVTVTLKYDKGFEAPWGVFRGSVIEVRTNLCAYFDIHPEIVKALSLHELVGVCSDLAHDNASSARAVAALAGNAAPATDRASVAAPAKESLATPAAEDAEADPWAEASKAKAEAVKPAGENPLLAAIAECASVDALKKLWASNQAAFSDTAVMDAWKAKGKSLQVAA